MRSFKVGDVNGDYVGLRHGINVPSHVQTGHKYSGVNFTSYLAVVAEVDGREAGCETICFTEELPSPDNPSGGCAYLMNLSVTEPVGRMDVRPVTTEIIRTL